MSQPIQMRAATAADWPAMWAIIEPVVARGDTYAWESLSEAEARTVWCDRPRVTDVALLNEGIVGTYILQDNQPGRGAHVANAAFMVAPEVRRAGVGRAMAHAALVQAAALGYTGMQFNAVVATNTGAIDLWRELGFDEVGRIPGGFRHATEGMVDLMIMYRHLEPAS